MTAKEGGLPGGDSEMFKELEMQVCSFKKKKNAIVLQ